MTTVLRPIAKALWLLVCLGAILNIGRVLLWAATGISI